MVDTPLCFRKSKSLFYQTFEIPTLRFMNFLMRHGKRELVLKCVTLALSNFLSKWSLLEESGGFFETWYSLLNLSPTLLINSKTVKSKISTYTHQNLSHKSYIFNYRYHYNNVFTLKFYLFRILKKLSHSLAFLSKKTISYAENMVEVRLIRWK